MSPAMYLVSDGAGIMNPEVTVFSLILDVHD